MERGAISTSAGDVAYWSNGVGPAVILLHGATMDHGMWQDQVHEIDGFRVIVPDLPGHGESRPFAPFSLTAAADSVIRIMDAEGIDAAHLVGQSMGGYVAQVLVIEQPHRMLSFLAVDASPFDSRYYSRLDRWLLAVTPTLLMAYPYRTLIGSIARGVSTTTSGRAYALETLASMSKREIATIMRAVYDGLQAYSDRRLAFDVPVSLVYGEQDRTGKVITYTRRWAEEEGLPLLVVPGAGHNSNMDNPAAFNTILLDHLSSAQRHTSG